ncbi:MAG: phosphonate metabolism protein/1,5-bisphosphokinase (PRPP-forming) PhnN [Pseudomonadota bacterium]|nr:phosphonate metabolism protein/1,5-bisphosphokinase (PRPP-forming) PhnN [Pseudomonadota bacterium]
MRQSGVLIAVVGPSGVGKDSLLSGARERLPQVHFMRRTITRPADAGGERHLAVTSGEFRALQERRKFLFHWQAHDLSYGIPIDAENLVLNGHIVVFNGSRHALAQQRDAWPDLGVIWVAADLDIRAERLARRGRETVADIRKRLSTSNAEMPADAIVIENNGSLETGVQQMQTAISNLASRHQVAAIEQP